jgi:hypothetical protein
VIDPVTRSEPHAGDPGLLGTHAEILLAHPLVAGTLFASTSAGIFRTTDGGGDWTRLSAFPTTVGSATVYALAADPLSSQTL